MPFRFATSSGSQNTNNDKTHSAIPSYTCPSESSELQTLTSPFEHALATDENAQILILQT